MSHFNRAVTSLTAATAAAVSLTLALSPPAWAGTSARAWSLPAQGYADGACDLQFNDYGERFSLNDNLKDDAGCFGEVMVDGIWRGDMYNSKGAGTTVEYNYDFVEGAIVQFAVCVRDNGETRSRTCSNWKKATA
ncbi:hypothetical protein [Streptomyces sp. NPDC051636]|uniref:hypothetical protein n=1 Tax=Streptomyces sp. NPDC051636 TaxID=3365663 RepID=UPI0037B83E77